MRTILLSSGVTKLNEQMDRTDKLYITGFDLGAKSVTRDNIEAWDNSEPLLTTMQGELVLQADHTMISYTETRPNFVKLIGHVPENVPEIEIGNITLYCGFDQGDRYPFSFSATDAASIKLQTQIDSPGYAWWFTLILSLPGLRDRLDFSNLNNMVPEFLSVQTELHLPYPHEDIHDQFIVQNHSEYGGLHPIINSQNRHFGCPFSDLIRYPDPKTQWMVSGGIVGDGYNYSELTVDYTSFETKGSGSNTLDINVTGKGTIGIKGRSAITIQIEQYGKGTHPDGRMEQILDIIQTLSGTTLVTGSMEQTIDIIQQASGETL